MSLPPIVQIAPSARIAILERADYYLAESGPNLAARWSLAVDRTLRSLAGLPLQGAPCHLADPRLFGIRRVPVRGFERLLIFYRYLPLEKRLIVLNVIHRARDVEPLLIPSPDPQL